MTISWPLSRQTILDDYGRPYLVPSVNFYAGGTTTPITVFKDPARTVPHTQPVVADGFGRFPRVYLPEGQYREEVLGPYGEPLWNDDGLGLAVVDDTIDPVTPVDQTAIPSTGDVKWRLDASIQPGWVRMNGRTLGAAGSGATELADPSAKNAFVYLWTTFPESMASVVGGRGSTAAGDFAAGKAIVIPSMQGLLQGGLDDMGSSAAQRIQVVTALALTAGSAAAQVFQPNRITIGMAVTAPGVSAGTIVLDVNPTGTILLSQAASSGSTGTVTARFSVLGDTQVPGLVGGDFLSSLLVRNLPEDMPDGTVSVEYPSHTFVKYKQLASVQPGTGTNVTNLWQETAAELTTPPNPRTFTVPVSNPGGGKPFAMLPPMRLGTFFMKL